MLGGKKAREKKEALTRRLRQRKGGKERKEGEGMERQRKERSMCPVKYIRS